MHPESAGLRESWAAGTVAWFEYHCWENPGSADADLWYRSHQQVTVTGRSVDENYDGTFTERMEAGMPNCYDIVFADGHHGTACEDELLTSPAHYDRPDPPAPQPKQEN